MRISHIVTAIDETETSRQALRAAAEVAGKTSARITVLRVLSGEDASSLAQVQRWVDAALPAPLPAVTCAIAQGLPGVEIPRFAESEHADLIVLGRKTRSRQARLAAGDTADAVARRASLPCLFVPASGALPRRVMAAIDGTHRGMGVLRVAGEFARQLGAELHVVTVEPRRVLEPVHLSAALPGARSIQLAAQVRAALGVTLEVLQGDTVTELLAVGETRKVDVLVIGCHRGGPPGIMEAGSTARRLAHTAPWAILTVPL